MLTRSIIVERREGGWDVGWDGKNDKRCYDGSVYHGESFLLSIDKFVVNEFALFAYERSGFIILGGVGWGDFYSQNSNFDVREVGEIEQGGCSKVRTMSKFFHKV